MRVDILKVLQMLRRVHACARAVKLLHFLCSLWTISESVCSLDRWCSKDRLCKKDMLVARRRAVLTEKEKEERRLKRAVEKAERQLAKIQQREDKELSKLAEKDAKKEAPKPPGRAQKPHITDDVLVHT